MRPTAAGALVALALVFIGGECVTAADGPPGTAAGDRLVYVFSPDQSAHCRRAALLLSWVGQPGGPVRLIGVVRPDGAATVPQQLRDSGGFTVAVDTDLPSAGLPADLLQRVPAEPDYALLLDDDNGVVWATSGAQLAASGGQPLATDIDKSTWGKVKELFR